MLKSGYLASGNCISTSHSEIIGNYIDSLADVFALISECSLVVADLLDGSLSHRENA